MEIINGILYIEHEELVQSEQNPQGVMSASMYKWLLHTEKILRRLERGGNGRKVQIEYNSVPQRYRDDWEAMNGDPYNAASKKSFLGQCKFDEEALRYYLGAESADGSVIEQPLDAALARKYANEASVLGTIHRININSKEGSRRIAGRGQKVD
ncbi:MAG: hypothetical protein SNI32_08700, partial [Rikenellaceae bacterium]